MVTIICTFVIFGGLVLALWLKRKKTMDYPREARQMGNSNAFYKME
jgi:hypothetical protein